MRPADIERMYEEYAAVVYKYLMSLSHDPSLSEELTAETFDRAIRGVSGFRGDSTLATWLCAIAKRLYYAELRRRRRFAGPPDEALVSGQDIEREFIRCEDRLALYRELHALDEASREVFYLRLASDMTFEEIGRVLGKSGAWARTVFYRGKEKLIRRMRDES